MMKKVSEHSDFQILAKLLNDSFITVATEFSITKENCKSHNAFITSETLKAFLASHRELFYIEIDSKPVGFIAIEKSEKESGTFYIEKVAVHPGFRQKGIGKQLMDFATARILELGGKRVSVSLIDSHSRLKQWYKDQGYIETGTKTFEQLPFTVCFMDKKVG